MNQSWLYKSVKRASRRTVPVAAVAAIFVSSFAAGPAWGGMAIGHASYASASDVVNSVNGFVAGQLGLTIAPVVSGTPVVGERLVTTTGTWFPSSVAISFQWLADGTPIHGAIYSAYRPVGADVGKRLSAAVTASKQGYTEHTAVSEPTAPIRLGKARVEPNTAIGGEPLVGATLLAYTGTSTCCSVTLSLQWLHDGVAIPGATHETYVPVAGDIGKRIRLRVTASGPGYIPSTVTSAATAPVTAA